MNVSTTAAQPARPARRTAVTLRVLAALAVAAVLAQTTGGGAWALPSEPPERPTGLEATSVAHDAVSIAWDDPGDSSISGYEILRRNRDTDALGVFTAIEENTGTADTAYIDASVTASTRYVYRVKAVNSAGESPQSSYVNVDTPAGPPPPARPAGLEATSVAHDAVSIAWDDPGDSSISGYEILRRNRDTDALGVFTAIEENTGTADTAYIDASVTASTRYVYRVKAVNSAGESPRSSYVNVDTPAAPAKSVVVEEPPPEKPVAKSVVVEEPPPEKPVAKSVVVEEPPPEKPVAKSVVVEQPPPEEPLIALEQTDPTETTAKGNTPIFVATMTVGIHAEVETNPDRTITSTGFTANDYGSLSHRTFTLDSTEYTILNIRWVKDSESPSDLRLEIETDPALPSEGIVLSVQQSPAGYTKTRISQSLNYNLERGFEQSGARVFQPVLEPEFVEGDKIRVRLLPRSNTSGLRPGAPPNVRAWVDYDASRIKVEWEQPSGTELPSFAFTRYRVELIEDFWDVKETVFEDMVRLGVVRPTMSTTLVIPGAAEDKIYSIFITPMDGSIPAGRHSFGFVYVPLERPDPPDPIG